MTPVRVARAFQFPITAAVAALLLSGCMHAGAPVAIGRPQSDLDALAYGDHHAAPQPAVTDAGGSLRNAFAAASGSDAPAPAPAVYSAPPVPERFDAGYRLDAGDKLRVVVYGQDGLTNTYAIDAAGAITMPLIGQVPARGKTPASLAAGIAAKLRHRYIR